MATSSVAVTPGTGKNLATHSISEDSATKEISRINLNSSNGTELSDATGIKISTASQNANGQTTMANSSPVVIAKNQLGAGQYKTVAASQTAFTLGTGAVGDFLSGILVIPGTTSPGVVTVLDNAISIPVFVGGATSVSNLVPFFVPCGWISVSGAWKITTGANVTCVAVGSFT